MKTDLLFPLNDDSSVCANTLQSLESKLSATRSREFHLALLGTAVLCPDFVLAVCDLLQNRPAGLRLVTHARSSLMHGNILVWLAGDERIIRRDAWIFFNRPKVGEFARRKATTPSHAESWQSDKPKESERVLGVDVDYALIFRRICKYLPCELAGRRIWGAELSEWNLIGGDIHDND